MKHENLHLSGCDRIAVMGGTFDPIHYGHLVAAEAVRHEFSIEKVLFIPTGHPPHKLNRAVSGNEHRYLMAVLATATNPYFETSRIEIDRAGYTYTIDTIKKLREICKKNAKIYFITGADALQQILTWKDASELLGLCSFVAVTRPGYNKETLFSEIDSIKNRFKSKLHFLEVPALAISSSDIRQRIKSGKTIKYLLPESVGEYISKYGLYLDDSIELYSQPKAYFKNDSELSVVSNHPAERKADLFFLINTSIKKVMSEKRYIHTLGVVEEAIRLSEMYGEDMEKARIAALLHDVAKDIPNDKKKNMCKEYGIKLDDIMRKRLDLTHSLLGAEIAKRQYYVEDEDVLNAIRYHTTGREGMSRLEKIIYLADFIEPNRESFEVLEEVRRLVNTDLNKAFIVALEATIKFNKERLVHPWGMEALKFEKETMS